MSRRRFNCVGGGVSQCQLLSMEADEVALWSMHITAQVHIDQAENADAGETAQLPFYKVNSNKTLKTRLQLQ